MMRRLNPLYVFMLLAGLVGYLSAAGLSLALGANSTQGGAPLSQGDTTIIANQSTTVASTTLAATTMPTSQVTTVQDTTSAPPATVTQNAVANIITSFYETGLPANSIWAMAYGGMPSSSSGQYINFTGQFANVIYGITVQNATVGNSIFIPNPASGNAITGFEYHIIFISAPASASTSTAASTAPSTTTLPATTATPTTSTTTIAGSTTSATTTLPTAPTTAPTTAIAATTPPTTTTKYVTNATTSTSTATIASTTTIVAATTAGQLKPNASLVNTTSFNAMINARVDQIIGSFNGTYGNRWVLMSGNKSHAQVGDVVPQQIGSNVSLSAAYLSVGELNNLTALNSSRLRNLMGAMRQLIGSDANNSVVVFNRSLSLPYGELSGRGYEAGARRLYFLAYDADHALTLYNVTVRKAPSSPCIYTNLEPDPYCSNSTTPLQIHVPVIGGQYALTGKDWYPLNITFSASLLAGNLATFNFTVKDVSNGTVLTPLTTITANSVDVHESFRIPITQMVEISFSSSGDANYSSIVDDPVTVPANIVDYVPITFTNSQSAGVQNNFQLGLSVNSLAYKSYESSTLNNIEFFYANGTLAPSWLEGNVLNNRQTTNLYTSTNTFYWLSVPANFLPASGSNTVYMGFATTSFNLFDGITTGEAPQLASTYAQYDNGRNIFLYYNVNPASTTGWTLHGTAGLAAAPAGSNFGAANAFYANSANGDYMYTTVEGLSANEIISFDVYTNGLGNLFFLTSSSGTGQMGRLDGRGGTDYSGLANTASWTSWSAPSSGFSAGYNTWYKYDIVIAGTTASAHIGGNTLSIATYGTLTNSQGITDNGNYLGLIGDGLGSTHITYWDGMIVRYYPPGGVMPSASFGAPLQANAPAVLSITPNPVTYGGTSSLQATCSPSTDTCEILVNSVLEASGTGSTTYTFPVSAVGSYTVNAFNVNRGYSVLDTLTVGKATPALTLPNFQQNLIYGSAATVTANIVTVSDQLSANDYVNGAFHASFSAQDQFAESAVGTYVITANTPGNGNYFAASISKAFRICPAAIAIPAGIVDYACIVLNNSQPAVTGNYFQQLLNVTESQYSDYISYNGGLANFEYFYPNSTIIPAWIESNSVGNVVIWTKINPSIAANGNYIAYIGFAPINTNLLSSTGTNGIGEAPMLSPTYGEYDDGNSVFQAYFPGNSLTGWTTAGTAGQTASAPSGSPFGTGAFYANGGSGDYLYTQAQGQSANMIIEYYTNTANLDDVFFLASSLGAGQIARAGNGAGWYGIAPSASWTSWNAPPDTGTWSNEWVTIGVTVSAGSATMYLVPGGADYGSELGFNQSNVYTTANDGLYLGLIGDAAGSATVEYWNGAIIRSYPPGGVMPSASFGSVVSTGTCAISLSPNAIAFGSLTPTSNTAAQNAITDTNSGTTAANILVYGGDWMGTGSNSFGVGNTVWAGSNGISFDLANALTSSPFDTGLSVGASSSANVFFGAGVPGGAAGDVYTQTIVIENSC